jgi:RNA polymerase sigma-70 factor, ECF subfamily
MEAPADVFAQARGRLWAIAYRMLASVQDAEDVVQETYVRWHAAPRGEIANPDGWLTTTCVRLAVDSLRRAHRAREVYTGPWLPEPLLGDLAAGGDVAESVERADSLSTAFLLLLERLTPPERAAFLLYDVFGYGYAELAPMLEKSEAACRQLVSRAKRKLVTGEPRFRPDPAVHAELLQRFLVASRSGELEPLLRLLAEEAEMWSDGGGRVVAALRVVRGADAVARFVLGVTGKADVRLSVEPRIVNGLPGAVIRDGARVDAVVGIQADHDGRILRLFIVRNPDKLRHVE